MATESDGEAARKAKARAAFRRIQQQREAILSGQGRTKVQRLGLEDEIEGLSPEHQAVAAREGSQRRLVTHNRRAADRPVGEQVTLPPTQALSKVLRAHVATLDSGRLSVIKILRSTDWQPGQLLRAVPVADGLWRLESCRGRKSASAIVGERGRLTLLEGFVRGASVDEWPGVLVISDPESVFLADLRRASFFSEDD